jgi:hypothetical protein
MNIFEPSVHKPYVINKNFPIILRTACSAGVNRSATVREHIKNNTHDKSVILQQYGAEHGDYDNDEILHITFGKDGFNELFGTDKQQNIQAAIFKEFGYPDIKNYSKQILKKEHVPDYKNAIQKYYWSVKFYGLNHKKNIFVLINENENIINLVIKRLKEVNENVDLVILRIPDIIRHPLNENIISQTKEAYIEFIDIVKKHIVFV